VSKIKFRSIKGTSVSDKFKQDRFQRSLIMPKRRSFPSSYPLFSKHALLTGTQYLSFDTSAAVVLTSTVTHNLGFAPLTMVWMRTVEESGNIDFYDDTADIFILPRYGFNVTTGAMISEDRFYCTTTDLIIEREQYITVGGNPPRGNFYKFFLFPDGFR